VITNVERVEESDLIKWKKRLNELTLRKRNW